MQRVDIADCQLRGVWFSGIKGCSIVTKALKTIALAEWGKMGWLCTAKTD